ncbi:MAG: tetratricopeptide repeat protein [Anaerolineae bacterium]
MADMIGRRYRLEATLGEGGMGAVYRALDRLTGDYVAVKQVTTQTENLRFGATMRLTASAESTDMRLSLAQEFKVLASLRHPHIISVLDYGFEIIDGEARPYYTMELLREARTIVEAARGQPLLLQVDLLVQLLRALMYLHRRGIIHRDIKPTNVMVVEEDGAPTVKALDFGLSVASDDAQSDTSTAGTLAYMAPETLAGTPANEASDLYAVGVIAYEMFAGRHPFDTTEISVLLSQIFENQPDLSLIDDDEIAHIVGRLLAKSPSERFDSANTVIAAFGAATHRSITQETIAVRESFIQAARLVGRDEEMQRLTQALDDTVEYGRGSAWLIGGESGVGKSRLMEELRSRAQVRGALVLRGQSVNSGGTLYGLWRPTVRWLSLLSELSDEEAGTLKALVPDISMLLGRDIPDPVELPPPQTKERLFATVENLFRRQEQPMVVLLEDLHWSHESLDILTRLNQIVTQLPLLIVGSYRDDERPELGAQLPEMRQLKLERLDAHSIAELSEEMLGVAGRAQPVVDLLLRETEGNIFFLVEVVRALAEDAGQLDRVGTTTLPAAVFSGGIRRIVARRLERVPEDAQILLQQAAVYGRQLDLRILKALLKGDAAVAPMHFDLAEWLAICADASVLEVHNEHWRFTHDKLREGVLQLVDEERHPVLHRQVAQAIERVYPSAPEQVVALAYHWQRAGDVGKLIHYTTLAGEQAIRNGAYRPAKGYSLRALNALMALKEYVSLHDYHEQFIQLVLQYAEASIDQPSDDVLPRLHEAEQAADALGDEGLRARVWNSIGAYYFILGQADNSIRYLSRSIPLAEQLGLEELLSLAYNIVGQSLYVQGALPRATRMLYKCIGLAERFHEFDLMSSALGAYASVLSMQGRHAESLPYAQRAIETGEKIHLRRLEINLMTMGFGAAFAGQHDDALVYLNRSLESADRTQTLYTQYLALCSIGNIYVERGEFKKARSYLEQGIAVAERTHLVMHLPLMQLALYGHVELAAGNWEAALKGAQDALRLAQTTAQGVCEAEALAVIGKIYRQQGNWEEAEISLLQSITLHNEHHSLPRAAIATLELARLYQAADTADNALMACHDALAEFERMGMHWHAAAARTLLASLDDRALGVQ